MFKSPNGFDGRFLLGRTLELICFNSSQVYLHFDARVKIVIESAFSYERLASKDKTVDIHEVPVKQSNLMQLLEQKVSGVTTEKDETLTLTFESGDVLRCYATLPNYECCKIWNDEVVVII